MARSREASAAPDGGAAAAVAPAPTTAMTTAVASSSRPATASLTAASSRSANKADNLAPPSWMPQPLVNAVRSTEFFARVAHIYSAYKLTQARASLAAARGASPEELEARLWDRHHTWAGRQMYDLCISLRGFYLKAGQFIGARADFVPEQICRQLCLLQDRVPPMSPERTRQVVCEELGIQDLAEVFDWIDLEQPIGSASISQVHKAQLRRFTPQQLRRLQRREGGRTEQLVVAPGDTAWGICNTHGISLAELAAANRQQDLDHLAPGTVLTVPVVLGLQHFQQQQQHHHTVHQQDAGWGWLGLGRILGQHKGAAGSNSSSSSSSSSSSTKTRFSEEFSADESVESGSSSSGDEWGALPAGSSILAGGSEQQQQQLLGGARQHLLQLVGGGRLQGGRGGGGGARQPTLGASDDGPVFPSDDGAGSEGELQLPPGVHSPAAAAVAHALAAGQVPDCGLVAVKVQYPGALSTMTLDLVNLRAVSAFLQATELRFDLLSAVEELQRQIHLEFDFMREARVMDTIAQHLAPMASQVAVPRSVPGLVSTRLMVMSFMEGTPLLQLRDKVAHLPKWKRDKAARAVLSRVAHAYGLMILGEGLFQADGHPGNILVQPGGRVALLDYGQSKQLEVRDKLAFADLVLAMSRGDTAGVSDALTRLQVSTSKDDASLRAQMAYGMFDTRGKVDPFDADSPIKQAAIEKFPPDMFFVLRVVQLLRGMANGMGIEDFSTAEQWAPLARQALDRARKQQRWRRGGAHPNPLCDLAVLASPLRLTV